jgi:hypothetical protein
MTPDGRLKPSISNRHFGQEIERIRVEDLKFARQRRGQEDAFLAGSKPEKHLIFGQFSNSPQTHRAAHIYVY